MRIVHWDEMFHPTFGYQINVLAKYQAMLGHEVIILTGEHPENHPTFKGLFECDVLQMDAEYTKKYNVRIIRLPIYRVVSGMVLYRPGFLKRIKELKTGCTYVSYQRHYIWHDCCVVISVFEYANCV